MLKKKQTDLFAPNGTHEKKAKNVSSEQIRLLKTKIEQTARTFVKPTTGKGLEQLRSSPPQEPEATRRMERERNCGKPGFLRQQKMTERERTELFKMYERLCADLLKICYIYKCGGDGKMSYETVIEQVKQIPEEYLSEISDFMKYIQYKVKTEKSFNIPNYKKDFINLAGKIHLDKDEAKNFREASLI